MKNLPKIAIMGRTNVGKSTLFNCLIEKPKALISEMPGTTRDVLIDQVYWQGRNFELIDTGGIETIIPRKKIKKLFQRPSIEYSLEIIKKTQAVLKSADLILFLVDIQAGLLPQDKELAKQLKKQNKPIILIANKTDSLKLRDKMAEFYKLGLGEPTLISAKNGSGTGDLLDEIIAQLKKIKRAKRTEKFEIKEAIKITILGKPNVGKSSLLNAILGEDRVIVSPIPFTTREAIDTYLEYKQQNFILVDTAGIRKRAKISLPLEKASVKKSLTNAKNADICLLVIDISAPITMQESKLIQILLEAKVSIIIVANKWDLIEQKTEKSQKQFEKYIYRNLPYLTWAPIIFVSGLTTKNVKNILDLALKVYTARTTKIPDSKLNKFLKQAIRKHKPSQAKGARRPFIYDLKQIKTNPPLFETRIGKLDTLGLAYLKYLENSLREKFNLLGTPFEIRVENSKTKTVHKF